MFHLNQMSRYQIKIGKVTFKSKADYESQCKEALKTNIINDNLTEAFKEMQNSHSKIKDQHFKLTIGFSNKHQHCKCFKINDIDFSYKTIIESYNNNFESNNLRSLRDCIGMEMKHKLKSSCEKCGSIIDLNNHHIISFDSMVKDFCSDHNIDINSKLLSNETILSFKYYHKNNSVLKTLCKECHKQIHQYQFQD